MNNKKQTPFKIVLSGGPGSGKTTLINLLREQDYLCFEEVSRQLIIQGETQGMNNYFLSKPEEFSRLIWEERKQQYQQASTFAMPPSHPFCFFDRGLPDVLAYMDLIGQSATDLEKELKPFMYDLVFLIPPVKKIYVQDEQRKENFETAVLAHQKIHDRYSKNYTPHIVPMGSPEERFEFVLTRCHEQFL